MKLVVAITLLALLSSSCSLRSSTVAPNAGYFTEDEKHRLYSAALAASDAPQDTDVFNDVCRKIGIIDVHGNATDQYMVFVSEHVDWSMKLETDQFRSEISSKDKAREYIQKHLSAR